MSSEEENKVLARRFVVAAFSNGDLDTLDELMAPDFVDRSLLPGQGPSREEYKRSWTEFHAAFSVADVTIEDQIAEGDKVLTRATFRGVHDQGEFLGMAPTGEEWAFSTMIVHRIARGKIIEEWSESTIDPWLQRLEKEMRERERVEHEMRVARTIQQASLPEEVPTLEGWKIAPHCQPVREVGGDFYDFHLLPEGKLGLVLGDATGKGVPAALVMSTTLGMLQSAAGALGSSSPGEVLAQVNETLVARIPPNMFVTCFYAILDPKSGHLVYANAGHDLPYLRRRNGDTDELRARGMPLGLMPGMSYEEKETTLNVSEVALLYSDGLVEAHGPRGEMFDFPKLRG